MYWIIIELKAYETVDEFREWEFYEIFQLAISLFEFPMSSLRLLWFNDDDDDVAGVVPDDDDRLSAADPLNVPLVLIGSLGPQILIVPSSEHEANIEG